MIVKGKRICMRDDGWIEKQSEFLPFCNNPSNWPWWFIETGRESRKCLFECIFQPNPPYP